MARRRRKYMGPKYVYSRILFIFIVFGLAAGVTFYGRYKNNKSSEPAVAAPPPESVSESEPESEPESESVSEPEPEPEPEPADPDDSWRLLLVNPSNSLPEGYEPELEAITDAYRVDKRIADNVKLMFAKAREDGISLIIVSAYRSVEKQQSLFESKEQEFIEHGMDEQEAAVQTAAIIAVPGTSEHHTGLAMDIVTSSYMSLDSGFEDTPAFKWLDENAHKYGFVMRYPKDKQPVTKIIYEPWHYRYVGEDHAARIKAGGYCLEEYLDVLKNGESKAPAVDAESAEDGSADITEESQEGTEQQETE